MKAIHHIQQEIMQEFSMFKGELKMSLCHLVKLAYDLPPMPEVYKTDENLIKGCHMKVWLAAILKDKQLYFYADSNTLITKGLISLLLRIYQGQSPEKVMNTELYFMQINTLERFINKQRSNSFAAMIQHAKKLAESYAH